eukprot:c23089_g1_i1 orf=236-2590(+)
MKAFDPGGSLHPHGSSQRMALLCSQTTPPGEFSSLQFRAGREFFCSQGLKEVFFLEDAENRVLRCTCKATRYLISSITQVLPFEGPSRRAHLPPVLTTAEQFTNSRDNSNTSDGSVCNPDNGAGGVEEQRVTPVNVVCKGHNEVKSTMRCGNVQPEQENFGHVAGSLHGSLPSSSHPGASVQFSSRSLPNSYDSALTNFTSSQAVNIPKALTLNIACHDVRHPCGANEACIEDPEGPSTPDLQPEVRSWEWECDILCTKDADNMLPADNILLEAEGVMSTCMVQCPTGTTKCLDTLMEQGKDACRHYSTLSGKSYTFCDYWEGTNRRHVLRKPESIAHRRYMVQRLFYCFKISALGICAAPNRRKSHLQSLQTLRFRLAQQKLLRLLKGKEGEVICEQLLADIQLYLQAYKQRLIPYRGKRAIDASTAARHSRRRVCKQVQSTDKSYAGRNGHHKKDNQGIYRTNQCSSILFSKMGIDSASELPISLEVKDGGLPMGTEPSSEVMDDVKEDLIESHGSTSCRVVKKVDDWNSIPIDQVGECLDTCLSDLQCCPCLPLPPVDGPHSHTPSQCISSSSFTAEELTSSMPHGGLHERQSKEKLEHFAEGFLLRRHIIQQQRRAQQAPPFPPRYSVWSAVDDKGTSRRLLADVRTNPPYTCLSMQAGIKCPEVENHEPAMIFTSSVTKPWNVASSFCDRDGFVGADVIIDIVGLVKYIESNSSQLEASTDVVANSISYTYMPLTGGHLVIPNVSDVLVTIVTFVVYTRILLEGALAWVGARTHTKEED